MRVQKHLPDDASIAQLFHVVVVAYHSALSRDDDQSMAATVERADDFCASPEDERVSAMHQWYREVVSNEGDATGKK